MEFTSFTQTHATRGLCIYARMYSGQSAGNIHSGDGDYTSIRYASRIQEAHLNRLTPICRILRFTDYLGRYFGENLVGTRKVTWALNAMSEPDLEKGTFPQPESIVLVKDPDPPDPPLERGKGIMFREHAKIWGVYLQEAEEKAIAKAGLWNTGLDSLLIYAGLLASIIASFIIDARKDIQIESEPRLLTGIFAVLRGSTNGDAFTSIPGTTFGVSGLWIVSLFTTIFSATMALLAKAWLAEYVPKANQRGARDAYQRYTLDWQANRWHDTLVRILVSFPLRLASVLFLIGLIMQIYGDSAAIAHTLLGFCIAGATIFLQMTIYPVIGSSRIFLPKGPGRETDVDKVLREVLYTKLILSAKVDYVEEAIAEISRPDFDHTWIDHLSKNSTPSVVLRRFGECAISKTLEPAQRNERLNNHLVVLLSFVDLYGERLKCNPYSSYGYEPLRTTLLDSLEPGSPMYRWNELPEAQRPLLFALRINTLLTLHCSSCNRHEYGAPFDFSASEFQDRPWVTTFQDIQPTHRIQFMLAACRGLVALPRHLKTISAFVVSIGLAKAALTAAQSRKLPGDRREGILLAEDRHNIDTLALHFLSRLYQTMVEGWEASLINNVPSEGLAAAPREIGFGSGDRWTRRSEEDVTFAPCSTPVGDGASLHGGFIDQAEMGQPSVGALHNLLSGIGDEIPSLRLKDMLFNIGQQIPSLTVHVTRMLQHASSANTHSVLCQLINSIASMTVYDDQDLQEGGVELLDELSTLDEETARSMRDVLASKIRSAFQGYEDQSRIAATARFIERVAAKGKFTCFEPVVRDVIPLLAEVALDRSSSVRHRLTAVKLCQNLWHKGFLGIDISILDYIDGRLNSDVFGTRYTFLNDLRQLLSLQPNEYSDDHALLHLTCPWRTHREFIQAVVMRIFGRLVEVAIYDGDSIVFASALEVAKLVARDKSFRIDMHCVLKWLDIAAEPSSHWPNRLNALRLAQIFADHLPEHITKDMLKKLLKVALEDNDNDVRMASLQLMTTLCGDCDTMGCHASMIKDEIVRISPHNVVEYESFYRYISPRWIPFLVDIARHVSFPEIVPVLVQLATTATASDDGSNQGNLVTAFLESCQFAEDITTHETLRRLVPKDLSVKLPGVEDVLNKCRWVKCLTQFLSIDCLRSFASEALHPVKADVKAALQAAGEIECRTDSQGGAAVALRQLLERMQYNKRVHWVDILATLASSHPAEFPEAPNIMLEMSIHDSDVRTVALPPLRSFANSDSTRHVLLQSIETRIDQLTKDDDCDVRLVLAQVLGDLGSHRSRSSTTPSLRYRVTLSQDPLPDRAITELTHMVTNEVDECVCAAAVNSLTIILADTEVYPFASRLASKVFNLEIMVDKLSGKSRRPWLKLIASHIGDSRVLSNHPSHERVAASTSIIPLVDKVFDIAVGDEEPDVRGTALDVLGELLRSTANHPADLSGICKRTTRPITGIGAIRATHSRRTPRYCAGAPISSTTPR
ncbi:hypothetical protein NMY22_g1962 [Coprinellus aureogranulatus]|nr:hypothetical protein NMY22_g1962 [Coprinellus aureogranulatus]